MTDFKVVLFDVDGVLIIPPKLFAEQYSEQYGVDHAKQVQFYATKEFQDASIGKFDLKEAIRIHNDKWQWHGNPDELLRMWFEGENYPNDGLLKIIERLRKEGVLVYLATQQEKYRAAYLKKEVFKDKIDGLFVTCDIGFSKNEDHFWRAVVSKLNESSPTIKPKDIAYFDDRQSLVDKAKEYGINSFLYTSNEQVSSEFGY
jgi:FMN phosphatase YigB (HAD superfamily)